MRKARTADSGTGTLFRKLFVGPYIQCEAHVPLVQSPTAGGKLDGGRGSNGGIWEWTSTLLDTHNGFEGTTIFPGYVSFMIYCPIHPSKYLDLQIFFRFFRLQTSSCGMFFIIYLLFAGS